MRDIVLDICAFDTKAAMHQYLKNQLEFSDYYGANLDALYDELTSTTENTALTLRYAAKPMGEMAHYLPRVLEVFQDAAQENYHLSVNYEEIEQ